jgi:zinc transporter ZupT
MNPEVLGLSIVTFASTMLGGLVAARYRSRFGLIAAFAAGVLVAVPLFDLLPEAMSLAAQFAMPFQNVMYPVAAGFIFLMVMDRYISVHRICKKGECRNVRHPRGGIFGASELSVHSFMDGVAIGLGFQFSPVAGAIVAFAVIAHDFSDGISTVTVMLNADNSMRNSLRMLLIDAAAPVAGAIFTLFFLLPKEYLVYLLPFFSGGFLYIGSSDLLPQAHEKGSPLVQVSVTISGFLAVYAMVTLLSV